ncbi:MAG: glycosyltransferase [Acidobacteria bacterium]|nr:glycosyltransferase [Acidobacteriota bacterium]
MQILWVKMGGLWPATTGGRVRSLQIVSELARRHAVTVVTTHGPGDDPDGLCRRLPPSARVVSIPYEVPKRGSAAFPFAVARSWFSRYPVDLWKWQIPSLREHVHALIERGTVDLCVADFLFAAVNVPTKGRVPIVLFEHNVEHLIWQRLCALEPTGWRRALLEIEWRKLRAREADACRNADLTIAVSDDDRRRLATLAPDARISAIPTGVDTDYFSPNGYHEHAHRIVFSGSMDWHPNEDAVLYFVDTILPRIRAEIPDASFTVVGRRPSARLRELAVRPGIVVTGTVDDVRPFIAEASVYVVPLRAGSGTRLKIFEALAMAKPVVSTTVGAEGLGLEPERHFVPADDATAFADAVVRLLRDSERRRALGGEGRSLVEAHYSWATVARTFERRCEEVTGLHADLRTAADRRPDLSRAGSDRPRGARVVAGERPAVGWFHHHS